MSTSTECLPTAARIAQAAAFGVFLNVMVPATGLSQQTDTVSRSVPGFDIDRARLNGGRFQPFQVGVTQPLREVLANGLVEDDTPILVLERKPGRLALVTSQMSYHHIAQGEMEGEPWMVSF